MDLGAWLRGLGLGRYEQAFRDNDVDAEVLPELTADDLAGLGVGSSGHRRKLLAAIAALRKGRPRGTPPAQAETAPSTTGHIPVPKSSEAERRQLTVMFVDLVGSTALSTRLDPEEMHEVIRAYQDAVAGAVARYEGHIGTFMGDGVLAYFGFPQAHEDNAERAVRAGLDIPGTVGRLRSPEGGPLAARVGIATGLVVVGDLVGSGPAQEQAVVGETPNLAARLQALAEPGTVVIAQATRQLVGGLFECADLGGHRVRGFVEPIRAWRVLGPSRAADRFEALHGGSLAPMVGRDQEIALLLDRWRRAKEGEGQVVLLAGEPGIGKSRLMMALRERLQDEPYIRLSHSCSPYHVNSALWPVTERLMRAAGFARDDTPALRLAKLEWLLEQAGEPAEGATAALAELLGLPPGGHHALPDLTPQQKKGQVFAALLAQLDGLAHQGPVLLTLEDLHWLDPTSRELFDRVVDRTPDLPVLFVATFRPELPPPWSALPHVTLLSLNRLARAEAAGLIERQAGGRPLPPAVSEAILSRTEGVPLFVEELTKAVLESGLLQVTPDGTLELARSLSTLAIPSTLQDSLMARLDRLAPVKEVAQIAACIGREFDHALLAAVAQIPEPRLVDALDQFLGVGLVFHRGAPSDAAYSFKHALVRDAAYASLLRSRRRQLHARIANAIEATRPQVAAYQPELLAHHLTEAGLPGRAVIYALSAGRLAKGRHAVQEATSQLESCLRLAAQIGEDAEPTVRATTRDCLVQLGDLASMAEDLERANAYYDRAVALAGDEAERSLVWGRRHCLGYAQRGRARLAFYDHGSGEPTIVFLNPIVYGLATFQAILERLCQEFRIITVDCRGAGRSDPLHRPYGVRQHMEDLRAIVEAAGAAPIVGVGISRGSNVLVHLAHDHPRLIARLVLVGMPLIGTPLEGRPAFDPEYLERRREYYLRGDTEELLRLQARFVYTEPDSDELRRLAEDRCRQLPIDTFLSFYDPDPDMDVVPLLGSLDVPTLVMHGRADRLVAFASGEFVAASIPGAELYGFEGKGHLPSFSATDEFCGALRNFVRTGRAQPLAVRDEGEARSSGRRCRHRPASQPAHVSSGKVR